MLEEIFIEFSGRVFHAPAWHTREDDAKKSRRGECVLCRAVKDNTQTYGTIPLGPMNLAVAKNTKPYAPGHILLVPDIHRHDPARLDAERGEALFNAVMEISERLGRNYWIFANVGWVAGQSIHHMHFHVLADPWHISTEFAEEAQRRRTFDPLTDVITEGIRAKKFYVRYGDAHMSGIIVSDFRELKRTMGQMRTKFGEMREVLYQQREAMLEQGKMPALGYHILVINYKEPQMAVIPRVFVPKRGRWAILELLYNADLRRDLTGEEEKRFWKVADPLNDELARRILSE